MRPNWIVLNKIPMCNVLITVSWHITFPFLIQLSTWTTRSNIKTILWWPFKLNFNDKWIFVSIFGITVFTIVDKRWLICQYILLWSHQTVNMYGQNIEYVSFIYTSLFSSTNYISCWATFVYEFCYLSKKSYKVVSYKR